MSDHPGSPRIAALLVGGAGDAMVLGLTLAERHVGQLELLGVAPAAVAVAADPSSWSDAPERWEDEVVVIAADAVFDPRLYRLVLEARAPLSVTDGGAAIGLGRVGRAEAIRIARGEASAGGSAAAGDEVEVASLPEHQPSLRRRLRPYAIAVRDEVGGARAAGAIMDAAQKGILDFPARYFHPPFENWGAARLAPTAITPNQVTVASGVLGLYAAWLLGSGSWVAGLLLAVLVNVMDGVDGKLARVTLRSSWWGDRLDHSVDILFEFTWYLGLGISLTRAVDEPRFMYMGVVLIAIKMACRLVSGSYRLLSGHQIHDHTGFDRGFRLIAGRRNIYVVMWVAGLAFGLLPEAFAASFAWAAMTLAIYLGRNLMALAARGATAGGQPGPRRRRTDP